MTEKTLNVYLYEHLAGFLKQDESGSLSFEYDSAFLSQSQHALSLSLPLQPAPFSHKITHAFFSGLLPDEKLRARLAQYLGVSKKNPYALLKAVGGECAGAVTLFPQALTPRFDSDACVETLSDADLATLIHTLETQPLLAGKNDMRLSLAGAHDKLAVALKESKIALVKDNSPTTHILKLPITGLEDTVLNEYFCMTLAKRVGIDTAECRLYWIENTPYFLVKRYDRLLKEENKANRIHQEDFCQAKGIFPEIKYENEGGPGIKDCQAIIKDASCQPAKDQLEFIKRIIFNYLIGNADAHGKNFSLLYKKTKPTLAPAYDLLSTAIYPGLTQKMAMKIGSKYDPNVLLLRHWETLIPNTQSAKKNLKKTTQDLIHKVQAESLQLKNELSQKKMTSPTIEAIINIISTRSALLKQAFNIT